MNLPENLSRTVTNLMFASALTLTACGGGGGGGGGGIASTNGGGGIGGTGLSSTGTIDGFGSIFVNGVEFETDEADISVDGEKSTESALKLGMVVTVNGTVNDDGTTGNALEIVFDDEVQGPVASIEVGQDGDSLLLVVLGIEVIAERVGTVWEDVSFDTLAVGDLIEVSGFRSNAVQLRATRIEKKSNFVPGSSEVELKGIVANLTSTEFKLGEFVVDYSNADLSDIPGGNITEGMQVEVHGSLTNNRILANRVEEEDDIDDDFDDGDDVSVEGSITGFTSVGQFNINGVAIDATNASLEPAGLILEDGMIVEAEGNWNGNVLIAEKVKARRGRVEIEASVASVNPDATITLQFFTGTVAVQVDSTTLLEDDTDRADPLTLNDISSGDFLEIEAIQVGEDLVATRIDRDDRDDDILQARVESFNAGVDITLLGITFSTAGAEFENQNDSEISSATFYSQLQVGDLVKVKDEELADGIADEVEFEQEDALDGDEFDDDSDEDCDDGDSGSGDDCESDDDEDSEDDCGSGDDCESDDDEDSEDDCGSGDDCESEDDDDAEDPEDPEDPEEP